MYEYNKHSPNSFFFFLHISAFITICNVNKFDNYKSDYFMLCSSCIQREDVKNVNIYKRTHG